MKRGSGLRLALIGAGARGGWLARLALSQEPGARIVALAEPRPDARAQAAREFGVDAAGIHPGWEELFASAPDCDAAIIATMDKDHRGPAEAALKRGWHLLLEKPLSPDWEDCLAMAEAERASGAVVSVCHSLRYHQAFSLAAQAAASGRLGRLMTMDLLEQVGYWHFAHSFVRGNWRKSAESSFVLLAKSCHDLDYLSFLAARPCLRIQSFGALGHFIPGQGPKAAAAACLDCSVTGCLVDARSLYSPETPAWGFVKARAAVTGESPQQARAAMLAGPHGRCAWACDNDVADHQSVNMEFEGGLCATFTLSAFTKDCARRLRIQGTEGELEMREEPDGQWLRIREFSGHEEERRLPLEGGDHGGADARLVAAWLEALKHGGASRSSIAASLQGHAMAFAAERSRLKGSVEAVDRLREALCP